MVIILSSLCLAQDQPAQLNKSQVPTIKQLWFQHDLSLSFFFATHRNNNEQL